MRKVLYPTLKSSTEILQTAESSPGIRIIPSQKIVYTQITHEICTQFTQHRSREGRASRTMELPLGVRLRESIEIYQYDRYFGKYTILSISK